MLYAKGLGVPQDYVRAHMWLNLFASKGDEDAIKNRNIVANNMTPSQLEEPQKLARECVAKNYKGCRVLILPPEHDRLRHTGFSVNRLRRFPIHVIFYFLSTLSTLAR